MGLGVWEDAWGASLNWAARPELPPRGVLDVRLDQSWVEGGLLAFVEAVEVVAAVAPELETVGQLVCGILYQGMELIQDCRRKPCLVD